MTIFDEKETMMSTKRLLTLGVAAASALTVAMPVTPANATSNSSGCVGKLIKATMLRDSSNNPLKNSSGVAVTVDLWYDSANRSACVITRNRMGGSHNMTAEIKMNNWSNSVKDHGYYSNYAGPRNADHVGASNTIWVYGDIDMFGKIYKASSGWVDMP